MTTTHYVARCAGAIVETTSLSGTVAAACEVLGIDLDEAFTEQANPDQFTGVWRLIARRGDSCAVALIRTITR